MKLYLAKIKLCLALAFLQGVALMALMRATWRGYCLMVRAVWSVKR